MSERLKKKSSKKGKKDQEDQNAQQDEEETQQDVLCPLCQEPAEVLSVECSVCERWFHFSCVDISAALAAELDKDKDKEDQLTWTCRECNRGAKKIMCHIAKLSVRMTKHEDRMDEMKSQLDVIESRTTPVEQQVTRSNVSEIVAEQIYECKERELRKANVIIHNMPESKKDKAEERQGDDINFTKSIANELSIKDIQITSAIRIGKKGDKPRLTKIVMSSVTQKRDLMKKAPDLRKSENDLMKKIFITPDQTQKAREESKKLRDELFRRKDAGEPDLIIQKGKIVKRGTPPVQAGPATIQDQPTNQESPSTSAETADETSEDEENETDESGEEEEDDEEKTDETRQDAVNDQPFRETGGGST